jgi:hypothetical protein
MDQYNAPLAEWKACPQLKILAALNDASPRHCLVTIKLAKLLYGTRADDVTRIVGHLFRPLDETPAPLVTGLYAATADAAEIERIIRRAPRFEAFTPEAAMGLALNPLITTEHILCIAGYCSPQSHETARTIAAHLMANTFGFPQRIEDERTRLLREWDALLTFIVADLAHIVFGYVYAQCES